MPGVHRSARNGCLFWRNQMSVSRLLVTSISHRFGIGAECVTRAISVEELVLRVRLPKSVVSISACDRSGDQRPDIVETVYRRRAWRPAVKRLCRRILFRRCLEHQQDAPASRAARLRRTQHLAPPTTMTSHSFTDASPHRPPSRVRLGGHLPRRRGEVILYRALTFLPVYGGGAERISREARGGIRSNIFTSLSCRPRRPPMRFRPAARIAHEGPLVGQFLAVEFSLLLASAMHIHQVAQEHDAQRRDRVSSFSPRERYRKEHDEGVMHFTPALRSAFDEIHLAAAGRSSCLHQKHALPVLEPRPSIWALRPNLAAAS